FFFRAAAGRRDATVTGVQTCALPIYSGTGAIDLAGRLCGGSRAGDATRTDARVRRPRLAGPSRGAAPGRAGDSRGRLPGGAKLLDRKRVVGGKRADRSGCSGRDGKER